MDYFIQLIRPSQNSDELQSLLFVAELAQKWAIQESLHQRNAENEFHGQFAKNLLLRLKLRRGTHSAEESGSSAQITKT